ncbi:hypothetical protein [Acidiphilium acidophilum]|uniref:hypothetical protein n=1 Tax=Acidiphilium acidophilum TaxID=76588 RepID=UPI002E8E6A3D|nr:hypothetical protein [Acidiphilium acidophilum]
MSSITPPHPHAAADPIGQFIQILRDLLAVIARKRPSPFLAVSVLDSLCRHLEYFLHRLTRAAVTLAKPTVFGPPAPRTRPASTKPRKPREIMHILGWIPALAAYWLSDIAEDIGITSTELTTLLAGQPFQSLVARHPKLGRTIRPICRAFGIKPPGFLRLPQRPRPKPAPWPIPLDPADIRIPDKNYHGVHFGPGNRFWPPQRKAPRKRP